jgi:hypothetical protein
VEIFMPPVLQCNQGARNVLRGMAAPVLFADGIALRRHRREAAGAVEAVVLFADCFVG